MKEQHRIPKFSKELRAKADLMVDEDPNTESQDIFGDPVFEKEFRNWLMDQMPSIEQQKKVRYANELFAKRKHDDGARTNLSWKDDEGAVHFANVDFVEDEKILVRIIDRSQKIIIPEEKKQTRAKKRLEWLRKIRGYKAGEKLESTNQMDDED